MYLLTHFAFLNSTKPQTTHNCLELYHQQQTITLHILDDIMLPQSGTDRKPKLNNSSGDILAAT